MAHDVFISYATKDKAMADAACATLEARSIRCWIAPRDILAGTGWGEAIVEAINQSQVMVLVFSSHANESPHIRREVDRAVTKGVPIIPVRIEDVVPVKALEYYMSSVHWLDALTPPLEAHFNLLADKVHVLLRRSAEDRSQGASSPAPPPPPLPKVTRFPGGTLAVAFAAAAVILGAALWLKPWTGSPGPSQFVTKQTEVKPHDGAASRPPERTDRRPSVIPPGAVAEAPNRGEIERQVSQRLSEQGLSLRVEVSADRIVTLSGVVRNQEQKVLAMNVARVPGVKDVRPQINVQEKWQLQ